MMTLLFFGDVVGEPGRRALYRAIPELKAEYGADAVIVNGENAAGGRGITPPLVNEFFEHGVAAITLGDHVWDQQSLADQIDTLPGVLRPLNLQSNNPGKGSCIIHTPKGDVGVICLIGRTFMRYAAENPFLAAENAVEPLHAQGIHTILVDIHAEATSEKISLALHLAGRATAVLGTHTHVQTADARILPAGTAAITDVGMCGSRDGVIGRDAEQVLQAQITAMPCKLDIGGYPARVSGVVITADENTGRALSIQAFNRDYDR
ncbi:MAG: YmdB family metallophosphoesterase [Akkermansia sp.]|nr:YmdB family metallophosphoesterase [Akkermansia sp.]MBR3944931.1 YmdB family metallophosphoesterase [Akkermansia sp.]